MNTTLTAASGGIADLQICLDQKVRGSLRVLWRMEAGGSVGLMATALHGHLTYVWQLPKHEARGAVVLFDPLEHQSNRHFIGDQLTG